MKLTFNKNCDNSPAMHAFLRVFAVFTVVISLILFAFNIFLELPALANSGNFYAKNGTLEIKNYDFEKQPPIYIDGQWEYYPEIYFDEAVLDESLLKNPQIIEIPVRNMETSRQTASFKISLEIDRFCDKLVLYIPYVYQNMNVYVNNVKQEVSAISKNWMNFGGVSRAFALQNFDENKDMQEIIVSVKADSQDFLMLNRSALLSTEGNIATVSIFSFANAMLILGIMIIIGINGAIFMILRPEHKLISFITLFDTMLIFRVILGMNDLTSLVSQAAPNIHLSDGLLLTMQIFTLTIAGMIGVLLSRHLFDSENKIPKKITNILCLVYLALSCILPFNLKWFDSFGVPLLVVVYIITFIVVFLQFRVYLKHKVSGYRLFQVLKTIFIGIVILFDILYMTSKTSFLFFTYLYIIFFICHVFTRLYDNNVGYRDVEFLNQNLEKIVEERTLELSRANEILSELSIRDALTGTYNRLYFENEMEKVMTLAAEKKMKLHICMFDLDLFKNINDLYGHDAGDDQLRHMVKVVQAIIGTKGMLARIGGEEFVILFYDCKSEIVLKIVEEIRKALDEDAQKNPKYTTASFGVVKYTHGLDQSAIMKKADKCLYAAKDQGRNRVVTNLSPNIKDSTII